jgi:hypothetical protein
MPRPIFLLPAAMAAKIQPPSPAGSKDRSLSRPLSMIDDPAVRGLNREQFEGHVNKAMKAVHRWQPARRSVEVRKICTKVAMLATMPY